MGVLASTLSLGDTFDAAVLLPALIESECTVCDVVRLAMTCRAARAWVTGAVSRGLTPRLLRLLLVSAPDTSRSYMTRAGDFWKDLERHYHAHAVSWSIDHRTGERQLVGQPSIHKHNGGHFSSSGKILFDARDPRLRGVWLEYLRDRCMQWYPLLDDSLLAALRRWDADEASEDTRRLRLLQSGNDGK